MEYISVDGTSESKATWSKESWNPQITIGGKTIPWQSFRQSLNDYLSTQCGIDSDRLIGPFFLTEEELERWQQSIPNKLLPYLREDLLRFEPGTFFQGPQTSMASLIKHWQNDHFFREEFEF